MLNGPAITTNDYALFFANRFFAATGVIELFSRPDPGGGIDVAKPQGT